MGETVFGMIYVVTVMLLILHAEQRYTHGVWDGAFNQFLPRVRRAMREYDERRAAQILGEDDDR